MSWTALIVVVPGDSEHSLIRNLVALYITMILIMKIPTRTRPSRVKRALTISVGLNICMCKLNVETKGRGNRLQNILSPL
jgi:hypothetical protein